MKQQNMIGLNARLTYRPVTWHTVSFFVYANHFVIQLLVVVYGSIFGKRALLAIDHIMLALFWSYVPNMK